MRRPCKRQLEGMLSVFDRRYGTLFRIWNLDLGISFWRSRGWRGRRPDAEFQRWKFGQLRFLFASFTVLANEVEILSFSFAFRDTETLAVLPHITGLACNTVRAIILLRISTLVIMTGNDHNLPNSDHEHRSPSSRISIDLPARGPPDSCGTFPFPLEDVSRKLCSRPVQLSPALL